MREPRPSLALSSEGSRAGERSSSAARLRIRASMLRVSSQKRPGASECASKSTPLSPFTGPTALPRSSRILGVCSTQVFSPGHSGFLPRGKCILFHPAAPWVPRACTTRPWGPLLPSGLWLVDELTSQLPCQEKSLGLSEKPSTKQTPEVSSGEASLHFQSASALQSCGSSRKHDKSTLCVSFTLGQLGAESAKV